MPIEKQKILMEKESESEEFVVSSSEIYWHLKNGVANSLLGKGFLERKLKVFGTARNWRTVKKLVEL